MKIPIQYIYLRMKTKGPQIEKAMKRVIWKVSEGGMGGAVCYYLKKQKKNNYKKNRIQTL